MQKVQMFDSEKDAFIRKELQLVDIYLVNLQKNPGWRVHTSAIHAGDARSSLRKVAAIIGFTGEWWRDLLIYMATLLPIAIPTNFALAGTIFTILDSFINDALSFVTMEPKVIQTTIKVPYWFFFSKFKVVEETMLVPVIHTPHWAISPIIATLMVLASLLASSWLLKRIWIHEIRYRKRQMERVWRRSQTLP